MHRIIDHAAVQHGIAARVITRSIEGPIHQHRITPPSETRVAPCRQAFRKRTGIVHGRSGSERWPGTPGATSRPGMGSQAVGAMMPYGQPAPVSRIRSPGSSHHAEDRIMMVDLTFVPLLEKLAGQASDDRTLRHPDRCRAYAARPPCRNAIAYEDWLAETDADFIWDDARREYRRPVFVTRRGPPAIAERRALFAPLERAARDGRRVPADSHSASRSGERQPSWSSSRCSTPTPGPPLMPCRWPVREDGPSRCQARRRHRSSS